MSMPIFYHKFLTNVTAVLRKKCVFQFPGTKLPETECSATGDFLPVCPGKKTLIIINLSFFTI